MAWIQKFVDWIRSIISEISIKIPGWLDFRMLFRRQDKAEIPPKTERWITRGHAWQIIRDHPAGRKHMPPRPPFPALDYMDKWKKGLQQNYPQEMSVARAILDEVERKYPKSKQDGNYNEDVLRWYLDRLMIKGGN